MDDNTTKLILTGILAIIGAVSMVASKGETGIGWFVLGMILIWGL